MEKESNTKLELDDSTDYGGYLVLQLKVGDTLKIGDSTIKINEINLKRAKLAIKAKKHTLIRKQP